MPHRPTTPARVGLGFDAPIKLDSYSDATPPVGVPIDVTDRELVKPVRRTRKKKAPVLDPTVMAKVHMKLKAASFTAGGQDWEKLFTQYDKDCSESLELREVLGGQFI